MCCWGSRRSCTTSRATPRRRPSCSPVPGPSSSRWGFSIPSCGPAIARSRFSSWCAPPTVCTTRSRRCRRSSSPLSTAPRAPARPSSRSPATSVSRRRTRRSRCPRRCGAASPAPAAPCGSRGSWDARGRWRSSARGASWMPRRCNASASSSRCIRPTGSSPRGVRKDDRIAILLPNRPEWLIAAFAAAKVGAVSVAISTFSTAREIAWTLEHAQPTVVVTMEGFRGRGYLRAIHAVCPELGRAEPGMLQSERLPELRAVVSIDERRHDGVYAWTDLLERATEVRATALAAAQAAVSAVDVCYILYTSGSTATPKGVMLAHGGVIDNGFDIGERQHLTAADRVWLAAPLFWSFGSANALPAILTHGGTLVMQESFEPGEALALLDGERCSVYYGMANMARAILEHPERPRRALAAMRTGLTIGLPEDVAMTMEAVNARQLCNVYGATETYGNCAVTDAHDSLERRLTTQGLPLPGMQIRVVEPGSDRPLPPDEVGELRVRGCVTPGYYRDAEQTRAALDGVGCFVTGDLVTGGGDGRIRLRR